MMYSAWVQIYSGNMRVYLLFDIFVFCQTANFSYRQDDMLSCFLPCLLPLFHHKIWFHIFRAPYILFLKSDVLFFFTNNNWTNSFSNVWYQWDASRPCVRSRPCPPSPKKAIRFGPSKICLVLLQSSPQESKFLLCKATRQKTRPGCFCAKDCLDSIEMYTTQLLLLGKFEYTGGPIFKVVLEC